jgi:hypothetical protein
MLTSIGDNYWTDRGLGEDQKHSFVIKPACVVMIANLLMIDRVSEPLDGCGPLELI